MNKLKLLLRVSRPHLWPITVLIFIAGFVYSGAAITPLMIFQAILLSFPFNLLLNGINDIYDYNSDKINPRKRKITQGKLLAPKYYPLVRRAASISALLLLVSSILTLNFFNFAVMSIGLFVAYFYSAPPIRLKEKPPLDSIASGMWGLGPFALGFSFGGPLSQMPLAIYWLTIAIIAIHAISTIRDYTPDKETGIKTFATVYGKRSAAFFALSVFILLLFINIGGLLIFYTTLLFCALYAIIFVYPSEKIAAAFMNVTYAVSMAVVIIKF